MKIIFYTLYLLFFMALLGLIGVASNPPPNLGALSLVLVAGCGCGILACYGVGFLSLVLFLIYLGGMMVVFAYSVAFTMSLGLGGEGGDSILSSAMLYVFSMCLIVLLFVDFSYNNFWIMGADCYSNGVVREGLVGVSLLYSFGGLLLVVGAWGLLLVLFVILSLVRGRSLGAIRAA